MAEVKKNVKAKAKKSSKILDEANKLSNDELLEQILNKKKAKTSKSTSKPKSNTASTKSVSSAKPKKKVEKKEEVSSDDIYEKIRVKRTIKKRTTPKKKVELEVSKEESKVLFDDKKTKSNNKQNDPDDLIITREIRFDDLSSNLKNKKTLQELKEAIENFDKIDNFEPVNKEDNDIDLLPFIKDANYKLKKILLVLGLILLVVCLILGVSLGMSNAKENVNTAKVLDYEEKRILEEKKKKEAEELKKKNLYDECLVRPVSELDMTEDIKLAVNNLDTYFSENYYMSVIYEDLSYGFTYAYKKDEVYYAASTIKSLGALYVYTKAAAGELDLNDTVTYTKNFRVSYSPGVKEHKLGSKISLRDLVKYSVIYSDNSAHQMIVSYVGRSNLKAFGNSLGAKNTLVGGDNFGSISAEDGLIYMKALYTFFENNGDLGKELKTYFVEAEQKEIAVDNLVVANKYGLYKKYYHNIGIMYDEKPYVVSIFTLEGLKNREEVIQDISSKIYELHNLYKTNRENVCRLEVYGQ